MPELSAFSCLQVYTVQIFNHAEYHHKNSCNHHSAIHTESLLGTWRFLFPWPKALLGPWWDFIRDSNPPGWSLKGFFLSIHTLLPTPVLLSLQSRKPIPQSGESIAIHYLWQLQSRESSQPPPPQTGSLWKCPQFKPFPIHILWNTNTLGNTLGCSTDRAVLRAQDFITTLISLARRPWVAFSSLNLSFAISNLEIIDNPY